MEALQANHERPANPHERALPFSTVHPYGPPCESRTEAPGPTCLRSIARNRGSNGKENCDKLHFAGRRLPALANYFSKQVLKTILLSASIAFGALAPLAAEAASSCGIASYYGPGFHGRTTASGERFDSQAMTAAHRSLPFGSRVRVVNQDTGRSVTIRINDDGPHIPGRIIDLSAGAFSRIASLGEGLARVCVSKL
jgi:rare lipoprotein A